MQLNAGCARTRQARNGVGTAGSISGSASPIDRHFPSFAPKSETPARNSRGESGRHKQCRTCVARAWRPYSYDQAPECYHSRPESHSGFSRKLSEAELYGSNASLETSPLAPVCLTICYPALHVTAIPHAAETPTTLLVPTHPFGGA
jgi:hypothetical protein